MVVAGSNQSLSSLLQMSLWKSLSTKILEKQITHKFCNKKKTGKTIKEVNSK